MAVDKSVTQTWLSLVFGALSIALPDPSFAQSNDEAKLVQAAVVLRTFTDNEQQGIPIQLLQDARGIAIIPNVIRAGFILGARRGRGVLAVRDAHGEWTNPAFITLTGGSIGGQIGVDSADVILIFANDRSVRNIASGRFTLGGEASAVAGPLGRRSAAAVTLKSEVYVYMRSRGLFAGAVFEGARLDVDQQASALFYAADPIAEPFGPQNAGTPDSVRQFLLTLSSSTLSRAMTPNQASEEAKIYPLGETP